MASKRKQNGGKARAIEPRMSAVEAVLIRLESVQRDTNARLGRIEDTLTTSSRIFELMHDRLEKLEEGQRALVEGQKLVVDRLDRLVEASTRERTQQLERIARLEVRVDGIERGRA